MNCRICSKSLETEKEFLIKCLLCETKSHSKCLKLFHKNNRDDDNDRFCHYCFEKHKKYARDFIYEPIKKPKKVLGFMF